MLTCFTRIERFFLSSIKVLYGRFLVRKIYIRKLRCKRLKQEKKFEEKYQCTYDDVSLQRLRYLEC